MLANAPSPNLQLLENGREFTRNNIRRLQTCQPSWRVCCFAGKLAKGGKKGDIGNIHSKCIKGTPEAQSSFILSMVCREITKSRWDLRLYEKEEGGFGGCGIKPLLQMIRNPAECMF
jgi:hypothetical protein